MKNFEGRVAAITGAVTQPRNNLPPAVVLPERLVHNSGRVIPGQFAGQLGSHREPWFIEASPFHGKSFGAYPEYAFDHQERGGKDNRVFQRGCATAREIRWDQDSFRVHLIAFQLIVKRSCCAG